MSYDRKGIPFVPKVGNTISLLENRVPEEEGSLIFASDTGQLFFDTMINTSVGKKLKRVPVTVKDLTKVTYNNGRQTTQTISFETILNKMDRVPNGQEGNVPIIDAQGNLIDSKNTIQQISSGMAAVCFTEKTLKAEDWNPLTKTIVVDDIPNLKRNSVVIVSPRDIELYSFFDVYCAQQDNGMLKFAYTGDRQPNQDIVFNIYIYGEQVTEDEAKKKRIRIIIPATPDSWNEEENKKGYWCQISGDQEELNCLKSNSILTLSPENPPEAKAYNLYGTDIIDKQIRFHCDTIPAKPLVYIGFIENYT